MIIRSIKKEDFDAVLQLAKKTGVGFTSLIADENFIQKKIDRALLSLTDDTPPPEALYLFLLEDDNKNIVGICGIESAIGLTTPWYNYKILQEVHACPELNIYNHVEALLLCNDHTGFSELCTLFLLPDMRKSNHGHLLSKSRFMFMHSFPDRFSKNIFAELRGNSDDSGFSPFWESVGQHFFHMNFQQADDYMSIYPHFVADLMPRHPIYIHLLPTDAQYTIGRPHKNTEPAKILLEREGFRYNHAVNIFDSGPLLEAESMNIRTVKEAQDLEIKITNNHNANSVTLLLANQSLRDFRCTTGEVSFDENGCVCITSEQAKDLHLTEESLLSVSSLKT